MTEWNELTRLFEVVLARYGQEVTLLRGGTEQGRGLALIQGASDGDRQFAPTDRGIHRAEQARCFASLTVPFDPAAGETVLVAGSVRYDVRRARSVGIGRARAFWQAELVRREDGEDG